MRYERLYIAGVGSWFPEAMPVDEAIALGLYDTSGQRRTGQRSVAVAQDHESQPEMAAKAGRMALISSGLPCGDFGLLLHAVAGFNGMDGWNAASYLQHQVLDGHGVSFEIHQLSNGAIGVIELAAAFLMTETDRSAALITTADRFAAPAWDRWRAVPGLVFADGASAAVLTRSRGYAKIVSLISTCDAALEGMHRGNLSFYPYSDSTYYPISPHLRAMEFANSVDRKQIADRLTRGLRHTVASAVDEAGIEIRAADHILLPNFGKDLLQRECLDPLGIDIDRTTWRWGTEVGHAGAADQFAALDHLGKIGALELGQRVVMISIGGGFNWTCVVLEIIERPQTNGASK